MRKGEHFWSTFSGTPALETLWMLQAIAVIKNWPVLNYDIVTAYLHAETRPEERLPIRMPNGEIRALLKTCYGCAFSSRRYSEVRDSWILITFNKEEWFCTQSEADPCLFVIMHYPKVTQHQWNDFYGTCPHNGGVRTNKDGTPTAIRGFTGSDAIKRWGHPQDMVLLTAYVDDIDTTGTSMDALKHVRDQFHNRFEVKDGDPAHMLGTIRTFNDDRTQVTISMPGFINGLWAEFKEELAKRKTTHTPFPPKLILERGGDPLQRLDQVKMKKYQSAVGSLLWASRNCFPESALGCGYLCTMMSEPTIESYDAAMHALRYLVDHAHDGITFTRPKEDAPLFYNFYDASARPDTTDHRMRGGYISMFAGGPSDWASGTLRHVGVSTLHVEYQVLAWASRSVVHSRHIFQDMEFQEWTKELTIMLGGNDACTQLSRENKITSGNKWFSRELHFSRERYLCGDIDTRRIDTDNNVADMMTKPLERSKVEKFARIAKGKEHAPPIIPPKPKD